MPNPNAVSPSAATPVRADTTLRWSCREGDYALWVGTDSFLTSDRPSSWTIRDFWQLRDGDFVTITNRMADLPGWVDLHPLEVAGAACDAMMERLNAGYEPGEPIQAPNLWRARAGDRVVWLTPADTVQPIKALLDLRSCVMMIGENSHPTFDPTTFFGAPEEGTLARKVATALRTGLDAAAALGAPREFSPEWRFGG